MGCIIRADFELTLFHWKPGQIFSNDFSFHFAVRGNANVNVLIAVSRPKFTGFRRNEFRACDQRNTILVVQHRIDKSDILNLIVS